MLKYRDGEEQVYSRDQEPKTQIKYINPNTKYKCSKYEKDKDGNQDKRQVAFMMVGPQGETYIRGGGNTAVLNIPPSYQLLGLPLNYNKHHIIQHKSEWGVEMFETA